MRAEDFEYLYQMEASFWWFVAMRRITDAIVRKEMNGGRLVILDAGCGTGYNLRHYETQGHDVFGLDIASEAVRWVKQRGFVNIAQASATEIPFKSSVFDLVLSFEVLGQMPVESSNEAMREIYRVLKPGGRLFARTAAYEWLRSSHDEDLNTAHRFTLGELRGKLTQSGFEIQHATYANTFLFPVAAGWRLLKNLGIGGGTDVKPLPAALSWIDPIFRTILASESKLSGRGIALPFGLSAICYAQKPRTASMTF